MGDYITREEAIAEVVRLRAALERIENEDGEQQLVGMTRAYAMAFRHGLTLAATIARAALAGTAETGSVARDDPRINCAPPCREFPACYCGMQYAERPTVPASVAPATSDDYTRGYLDALAWTKGEMERRAVQPSEGHGNG